MTTTIIGIGLIGGSFGLSLKEHGLSDHIIGVDNSRSNQERALELKLIDRTDTLDNAIAESELIVLATPVSSIPVLAVKILNKIQANQTVMDMGSTKQELCEIISMHPNRKRFVATHPMWGTEYSGPEAAVSGAFTGRTVVICDPDKSAKDRD